MISAFADLAIDGGVVPLGALEDYLDRTPRAAVLALLRQVEGDGLIEFTPHPRDGIALRLTAKGAVRLWLWNWPVETKVSVP